MSDLEEDNSKKVREAASVVSQVLIKNLQEECEKKTNCGTPAEQIYLMSDSLAILTASICMSLDGFGKTYGIKGLSASSIYDYIQDLTKKMIEIHNNIEEKTKH